MHTIKRWGHQHRDEGEEPGGQTWARIRDYTWLARWLFPKSYRGRILAIACVGTHIPLLSIIFSLLVFVFRLEWRDVFSMGVADYQPGDDAATLYARADQALYRAKRHRWGTVEQA